MDQRTKDSSTVSLHLDQNAWTTSTPMNTLSPPKNAHLQCFLKFFKYFFLRLLYLGKLLQFFSALLTCIDLLFHMPEGRVDQHVALMWRCVAHTDRSLMTGGFRGRSLCKAPRSVVYCLSNAVQVYEKGGGGFEWGVVGGVYSFTYICMLSAIVLPFNPNFICQPCMLTKMQQTTEYIF